jgi:hypothetical protein
MFAEHTMKHIVTPTFPLQGQYDAWQVTADLGISNKDRTMPVAPAQTVLINEYVNTQLRAHPRAFYLFIRCQECVQLLIRIPSPLTLGTTPC